MYFDRETIRNRLHAQLKSNGHIIGVAAGAGISAKYAVKGGADFILALNSGRFRQMGLSSLGGLLPFGNCNELVMDFGSKEIVPLVREVPVMFGLCATDPTIQLEAYIQKIRNKGFSGINNYPTVGLIGGQFSEALEEAGISFESEVEAIRIASGSDPYRKRDGHVHDCVRIQPGTSAPDGSSRSRCDLCSLRIYEGRRFRCVEGAFFEGSRRLGGADFPSER